MKRLIIYKQKLFSNLEKIKKRTKAKICAVVKANAYGHGLKTICSLLKDKVDFFAVANLDEGLEIREFDKTTKVLIMGICENYELAIKNNLSVCIFDFEQLNKAKKVSKKLKQKINIHIKIDSGMNRLGFKNFKDVKQVFKIIENNDLLILEGVFTHFATMRNDLKYFRKQKQFFNKCLKLIPNNLSPIIHAGGSLALFRKNSQYDMLRTGIYLYGYSNKKFKPVMKVYSKIIHTKFVKAGENVGYSKNFVANKNMKIGIIPLGYDDGIPRNFIGKFLEVKGKPAKILSVCMDMTILEIENNIKEKDTVCVFKDASIWAKLLNTNEHDVLVNFNHFRGQRIIK